MGDVLIETQTWHHWTTGQSFLTNYMTWQWTGNFICVPGFELKMQRWKTDALPLSNHLLFHLHSQWLEKVTYYLSKRTSRMCILNMAALHLAMYSCSSAFWIEIWFCRYQFWSCWSSRVSCTEKQTQCAGETLSTCLKHTVSNLIKSNDSYSNVIILHKESINDLFKRTAVENCNLLKFFFKSWSKFSTENLWVLYILKQWCHDVGYVKPI